MIKKYAPWILLGLVIIIFLRIDSCNRQNAKKELTEARKLTEYWKDEAGNAHAKLQETVLEKTEMKEKADSIAKVLSIKPKQVVRYVKTGLRIDTTVIATVDTVTKVDTVTNEVTKSYLLDYKDSTFLTVHAVVPSVPQEIQIGLNADIVLTDYWKRRKKFLGFIPMGKKIEHTDIGTNNPYIKITNAEAFRLINKPKLRLKMGVGVGLGYDPWSKSVHPTINVGAYLIRSR